MIRPRAPWFAADELAAQARELAIEILRTLRCDDDTAHRLNALACAAGLAVAGAWGLGLASRVERLTRPEPEEPYAAWLARQRGGPPPPPPPPPPDSHELWAALHRDPPPPPPPPPPPEPEPAFDYWADLIAATRLRSG